ncbi:MAG TPA: chloride channel protein [Vicinamibacteria bacterium]|nr:chloride channel protein [Vicinamibacteria bacterium]
MRRERWLAAARRETRRFLLIVLVTAGVICGLVGVVFHLTLDVAHEALIGAALAVSAGWARAVAVLAVPALVGGTLSVLVLRHSPHAGSGLTLVRAAYARDPRRLDLRAWIGTLVATTLSLGSGAPLGPEGPTVVLTSGAAAGLARLLGLPGPVVRGMIPVGTAAGIAAIFNTPLTGVVFALEEVIGTASRGVLGGAILAAVAAAVVERKALGGHPLLPSHPAAWNSPGELLGFAVIGLVAGVAAGLLPQAVTQVRARLHGIAPGQGTRAVATRGALAGLAAGALGLAAPEILGVGYPTIGAWLSGGGTAGEAALAFTAKLLAVTIALAAPLVGGVFAPSLFLGAALGSATGHLAGALLPGVDPGAYALVGMGAFFAGFLRTPLASVLIVFELTRDYGLLAPLMLAVALASLVARRVSPVTLVERQLEAEEVSAAEGLDPLSQRRVRHVMTSAPVAVRGDSTVAEAWAAVAASGHRVFPVVDGEGLCRALVDASALAAAAAEGQGTDKVAGHARPAPVVATPDEPLDRVSLRLGVAGTTRCPVVSSLRHPRLVGFLAPSDLLRARVRAAAEDPGFEPLGR